MRVGIALIVLLLCGGGLYYDFTKPKEAAVKICSRQEPTATDGFYRVKTTAGDFQFHNTAPDGRSAQMYAAMPVGATVILKYQGNNLGKFVKNVVPAVGKTPNC